LVVYGLFLTISLDSAPHSTPPTNVAHLERGVWTDIHIPVLLPSGDGSDGGLALPE